MDETPAIPLWIIPPRMPAAGLFSVKRSQGNHLCNVQHIVKFHSVYQFCIKDLTLLGQAYLIKTLLQLPDNLHSILKLLFFPVNTDLLIHCLTQIREDSAYTLFSIVCLYISFLS